MTHIWYDWRSIKSIGCAGCHAIWSTSTGRSSSWPANTVLSFSSFHPGSTPQTACCSFIWRFANGQSLYLFDNAGTHSVFQIMSSVLQVGTVEQVPAISVYSWCQLTALTDRYRSVSLQGTLHFIIFYFQITIKHVPFNWIIVAQGTSSSNVLTSSYPFPSPLLSPPYVKVER